MANYALIEKAVWNYYRNGPKTRTIHRFHDTKDANRGRFHDPFSKKVVLDGNPSDFIVCDRGEMYFLEVKSTIDRLGVKSSLLDEQKKERTLVLAAGGNYKYMIYSITYAEWYLVPANVFVEKPTRTWKELSIYRINGLPEVYV